MRNSHSIPEDGIIPVTLGTSSGPFRALFRRRMQLASLCSLRLPTTSPVPPQHLSTALLSCLSHGCSAGTQHTGHLSACGLCVGSMNFQHFPTWGKLLAGCGCWMRCSPLILIATSAMPEHPCPVPRALPLLRSAACRPGKCFVILWVSCSQYSSLWAVFQLHESYTLFSFLLKYLRSKKDRCQWL